MDQSKYSEAQSAYAAGDYRTAAKTFLAAAGKGAAGNGAAYHMAGNSLMRLRRHQDAITVYGHALRDETYDRRGSLLANLGAAYAAIGEYAEAVKSYEAALATDDYPTPYRAYQGMASALCERGRVEEAAGAYRKAAIDPQNPDPGKALVNLGLCFMALNRPSDAAEAYKAALGFDEFQGRGKALANLGQAYSAMGDHAEAVKAFEKATQLHGAKLSAAAQAAYDASLAANVMDRETVDGWETGQMPPLLPQAQADGWDTGELAALDTSEPLEALPAAHDIRTEQAAAALGMGDDEAVSEFFTRTEEDMRESDREARLADRARRRAEGSWIKPVVVTLLMVVLVVAALGGLYWFGFGWPTQGATVSGLLSSYAEGQPFEGYWVAVPDTDISREMAKMPPVEEFTVDGVQRGRTTSVVNITVTPKTGSPLKYSVTLTREGFGWKVSGIENDWSSSGS